MAVTSTLGNSVSESHSKVKSQVPSAIVAPDSGGLNNSSIRNSNVATENNISSSSNNNNSNNNNECGDDIKGSFIEIEPLNNVMQYSPHSSQHTAYSISEGESSLSSFLSVLFEDDENNHREICIVPDNPKPEQKSIRELHLSYMQSALENGKPKCRWDHITEDNRDNRKHNQHSMPSSNSLSRTRTTQKKRSSRSQQQLQIRSSSFCGRISNTKRGLRTSNSYSLGQSYNNNNSAASMFLRMPERKRSPTIGDYSSKKQSTIVDRFRMMSDPGLMHLPMDFPLPNRNNSNRNSKSFGRVAQSQTNRFGDCEPSNNGNASWSKEDVREHRKRNSNCFLDDLIEPDGYEQLETLKMSSSQALSSCLEAVQERSSPVEIGTTCSSSSKKNSHDGYCSSSPPKKPLRNTRSPRTPTRRMKSPPPNPHHILLNTIPYL